MASENVVVRMRLVGNVTGTVYAETEVSAETIYKDPDLYLGYGLLAVPFYPTNEGGGEEGSGPGLDPEDTKLILQIRAAAANTKIGNTGEGGATPSIGHWQATIEARPNATVEIPNGGIT